MSILRRFCLPFVAALLLTACIPPRQIPDNPPPPLLIEVSPRTSPPQKEMGTVQPVISVQSDDCIIGEGAPQPSSPETDCTKWSFLVGLFDMISVLGSEATRLTEPDYAQLENEAYPQFIRLGEQCNAQWNQDPDDYEALTEVLYYLMYMGDPFYGYDSSSLLRHFLTEAVTEEFAQSAESIGCVKTLFALFIEYTE